MSVSGESPENNGDILPVSENEKSSPIFDACRPCRLPPDAWGPVQAPPACTARRNGAAPNRADSKGAGLGEGEMSDKFPLRGVRGPKLDTKKIAGAKRQKAGHQAISLDCARAELPPLARASTADSHRAHSNLPHRLSCGGTVYLTQRGGALLTPTARQEARATDKARGCLRSPSAP